MNWIAPLIGRPWAAGAVGPSSFDCRGLVAHVLREVYRLPVPTLLSGEEVADPRASAEAAGWRRVPAPPREGDVLLVHAAAGAHVGIFVRYGAALGVLHSVQPPGPATGVRFDSLGDLLAAGAFGRPSIWRHLD